MTEPLVDRCVCHERTFAEILDVARAHGISDLSELRHHIDFGQGCGTCRPYVRIALDTGRTQLPVIAEEAS
jgi:bacterioferritin-associated ferredoxin